MAAYTNGMVVRFLFREFIVGLVVAVAVASVVYLFMNKSYKKHYWLLTFFPAVISEIFPDIPKVVVAFLRGGLPELKMLMIHSGRGLAHKLFHIPLIASIATVSLCLSIVLLWSSSKKTRLPKHWKWYVAIISVLIALIHTIILDPQGF